MSRYVYTPYDQYKRNYKREWMRAKRAGAPTSERVDATEAKVHINALVDNGYTIVELAAKLDVCQDTLRRLRRGDYKRVHKDTAAAVLAIRVRKKKRKIAPITNLNKLVPAQRSREILEFLYERGVGLKAIAEATGLGKFHIYQIRKGQVTYVRKPTEKAILGAVDELKERFIARRAG